VLKIGLTRKLQRIEWNEEAEEAAAAARAKAGQEEGLRAH
jgi:hypothetical protein